MKTENWSRRDFLRTASAATLSALAAGFPRPVFGDETQGEKLKAIADTVIVLWMGGGMAHTETFDPKRYTPFEKGMAPDAFLTTFPSIDTSVDNINARKRGKECIRCHSFLEWRVTLRVERLRVRHAAAHPQDDDGVGDGFEFFALCFVAEHRARETGGQR